VAIAVVELMIFLGELLHEVASVSLSLLPFRLGFKSAGFGRFPHGLFLVAYHGLDLLFFVEPLFVIDFVQLNAIFDEFISPLHTFLLHGVYLLYFVYAVHVNLLVDLRTVLVPEEVVFIVG
jgi:hypothetical protein